MDELYQDLKMMDYIIICLTNKYRLVHSYIQGVADIFAVTIDEYHKLIQKIISLYKESLYNSVHANLSQLKEDVERQRAHDKNLMEIKENLKRAIKLTKTGEICTTVEAPEKRQIQMDTTLKIDPPYDTTALYKFRHYRNTFVKRYSTITKNENYLNANEQRKRFLRKLRSSAKVTKERNDRADGIFKDEQKNMIRIVSENHIFQESHKLKEVLIVNKFLNKAKSIVNDVPQFLWKIIEEFERTESVAQENMYLFVLLALNKWLKKIVTECERFISLNRTKGYRKKTDSVEIHKKMSDYMNDILQRGAEQTMMFSEEKALFQYPPHINFNVNTSFLTYFFLYMDKHLFDFVEGFYSSSTRKKSTQNEKKKKVKLIKCYSATKESSLYMSSDMYSYQFRNEHEEDYEKVHQYHRQHGEHKQQQHHKERKTEQSHHILHLSNLMYRINQEDMYPNIFLICNYLLLGETKKIIELVYQMQRNSFDLLLCYDASVIIQLIICLFSNLKRLFAWGTCHAQPSTTTTTPPHMAEEEEPYYDDLRKCISETKINYLSPNSYVKCLGHIRLMLLNVLKTLHTMTKEGDRNYVCTFWEKTHIPMGGENQPREDSYTHERDQLIPIKNGCIKNNCYFFHEKKRTDVSMDGLTQQTEEHTNRIIQRRILCYDFYKFVIDHVKTVKLLMENRSNREEYTGILIKRNNRYNIDGGVSGSTRSGGGARGKKSTPLRGRPSAVRKVSKTAGPYAGVSSAPIHLNPTGGKIFIEIANKTDSKGKVGQRDPPKAAPPKKGIQSSVNPSVSTTTTPTQIAKKQVVKIRRGLSSTRHSSQDIRNKTNPPPKWVSNAGKTSAPSMKQ
ncbi:conserved Plasmodium protein, unknown function [Plasmodium knowlesi strain H]|uniref:Uncharacterized protein n=3 Tax=Plasmodium knowlesi TaxID=5850 RepID=A0A5K1V9D7_PLAKH|nr:conserved Plasmodium protein, unknown function [Plasmodium knowlesi strain H]OTN67233.1 Uncharacterized protein PKNOH_S06427600 [Plasmodium knowlesi]CAA9987547.1 conserved Plasmodium protein, unknown function [Plasmodium knowlesi strain H]SBO23080.1 conserved Plasmodium protein, unknown function [Plasmodium knowlesi strain H]SBO23745.1 conserved Plasmodium protein, unknown function [Plasmodium knowlesi strain H]VVS77021.1 conserved Plasmodium protein, unknown function [Plasmodium knowlesi s|eukprot:XP_002258549.1 hypothetical protein, conserved in Plasmodium species [Plasmodium knowlesi strain H]